MKVQFGLIIYIESIYKMLSDRRKDNIDNLYLNNFFQMIYFIIKDLKKDILKETTEDRNNNYIFKNNVSSMNYFSIIIIIIFLFGIFIILIQRKLMKRKISNQKKDKKRYKEKKIFADKKKESNKINSIQKIITNINFITKFIIKFIIIIIFCKPNKCNKIDCTFSKISLKIKGTGQYSILGNFFEGINYIKEIYINGINQTTIIKSYIFNQTDNFVELILDDYISSCKLMFFNAVKLLKLIYRILTLHLLHR